MTDQTWNLPPEEIERRSMAIIDAEAGAHPWGPRRWAVVRRMIHTTADFDWRDICMFHDQAIDSGLAALQSGRVIVTDTRMAQMGLSPWRLDKLGVVARCLVDDPATAAIAKARGVTRSLAAVDLAVEQNLGQIFVIGNAPTALLRLLEHCDAGRVKPSLVVGLPVGFVNAAEAKDALGQRDLPFITARGRKGGSAVAASVINALAIMALENDK